MRENIFTILENCKTCENFKFKIFKNKGEGGGSKTVIYRNSPEKNWDFSRSRMMKRIAPLESSHEILLPNRISLNSEIVRISRISRQLGVGRHMASHVDDTWRAMWMTHGEPCGDTWQAMCHNAWQRHACVTHGMHGTH